jgi:dipeptidase E
VLGGDVNWLLDWVKISKLDTYLHDLLLKGVIYIGASAGSMICTPDIGLTWWEPHWKLDHVGLGLVDFLIVAHQNEADEQKNKEKLIQRREYLQSILYFPWKIYLLQDGQAIKVIGDRVEHIGPGIKNSFPSQSS